MDEIRDQQVLVEDLLGADGRRLVEELVTCPTALLPNVESRSSRSTSAAGSPPGTVPTRSPTTSPPRWPRIRPGASDGLRRELDLSERQLLRRCTIAFGYGPATLRRILRLQRFLSLAGESRPDRGLADLAQEAGYADQQHLARDAKAIARATPSQLVADRTQT